MAEVGKKIKASPGRVCGDAHLQIREREGLRRGQAADVSEPVAETRVDARHQLDIPNAIFETDEIRAGSGHLFEMNIVDDGVIAVIKR